MFHRKGPTFLELARQALSSTCRGYDLLAPKFDYTPFRTNARVLQAVSDLLGELGEWRDGLDLCCGTGAGMEMLANHCSRSISGVDFSEGMLAQARENLAESEQLGDRQVSLMKQDVLQSDLPEGQFDIATCFGALGHILPKYEERFIDNVARCLRPNGSFVFVTSTLPSKWTLTYWGARGFNAAMHVRNFLVRPHFIMFYLTFLWPDIKTKLESRGFQVECFPTFPNQRSLEIVKTVVATKAN